MHIRLCRRSRCRGLLLQCSYGIDCSYIYWGGYSSGGRPGHLLIGCLVVWSLADPVCMPSIFFGQDTDASISVWMHVNVRWEALHRPRDVYVAKTCNLSLGCTRVLSSVLHSTIYVTDLIQVKAETCTHALLRKISRGAIEYSLLTPCRCPGVLLVRCQNLLKWLFWCEGLAALFYMLSTFQ